MKRTTQTKTKKGTGKKISDSGGDYDERYFKVGTVEELGVEGLAAALSGILYNPNLPETLRDGIQTALCDVFNELTAGQKEFLEYEKSPEYIEKLLYASLAEETED